MNTLAKDLECGDLFICHSRSSIYMKIEGSPFIMSSTRGHILATKVFNIVTNLSKSSPGDGSVIEFCGTDIVKPVKLCNIPELTFKVD